MARLRGAKFLHFSRLGFDWWRPEAGSIAVPTRGPYVAGLKPSVRVAGRGGGVPLPLDGDGERGMRAGFV